MIVLGAKLAKADGAVSRIEVDTFKEVFDVRDEDVGGIAPIFDEARRSPDDFEPHARQIAAMFADQPEILEELLDQLFVLAAADGALHPAEIAWLGRAAQIFGFAGPAFEAILARYGASRLPPAPAEPDDAYALLGLERSASDGEIKAAWRRLVREHHPDRMAQGAPQGAVDRATDRLAAINAAYDRIARERGLG
jgi:DnaJ like chaperone protein